jgi:hypothetical protein
MFELREQPTYDASNPKHDHFMVNGHTVTGATEVLDVDRLGGEPDGRERLCVEGVHLPLAQDVPPYIRSRSDLWARIPFVRCQSGNGLCRIDPSVLDTPLRFIEWGDEEGSLTEIAIEGHQRFFLAPEAKPDGPPRLRDWADDATVLKRVFARLRKWDKSYSESLASLERAAQRVAELLAAPSTAIHEPEMERARLERVTAILARLRDQSDLVELARNAIEHGPVLDEIERQKKDIFSRVLEEAQSKVGHAIAEETSRVADLEKRKGELQGDVRSLEAEIRTLRRQQEELLSRLDESLTTRLEEILARPETLLAELAILRGAQGILDGGRSQQKQREPTLPSPKQAAPGITTCADLAEFFGLFQSALLECDAPRSLARPVLSSCISGLVPLLHGARAREAFEAFGQVSTGGEVHWLDVAPTCTSPADLLSAGLGQLMSEVVESDVLRLVVLEGVNRAPLEAYLLPILDCCAEAWRNRQGKSLKWQEAGEEGTSRSVRWPKNLLLCGTLVEGATTLGIPDATWSHATLVLADELAVGTELDILAKSHPAARAVKHETLRTVSCSTWETWRRKAEEMDLRACAEKWTSIARDLGLTRASRDPFLSLYAASMLLGAGNDVALGDGVAHIVSALAASKGEGGNPTLALAASAYPDLTAAVTRVGAMIRP